MAKSAQFPRITFGGSWGPLAPVLWVHATVGFRRTEFSETRSVPLPFLLNPICRGITRVDGPGLHAEFPQTSVLGNSVATLREMVQAFSYYATGEL
jgi:hypothetical protein